MVDVIVAVGNDAQMIAGKLRELDGSTIRKTDCAWVGVVGTTVVPHHPHPLDHWYWRISNCSVCAHHRLRRADRGDLYRSGNRRPPGRLLTSYAAGIAAALLHPGTGAVLRLFAANSWTRVRLSRR